MRIWELNQSLRIIPSTEWAQPFDLFQASEKKRRMTMSNSEVSEEDHEWINYLMRKRREVLESEGPESQAFYDIDETFQRCLKKNGLEHTEYIIGWLPKKPNGGTFK